MMSTYWTPTDVDIWPASFSSGKIGCAATVCKEVNNMCGHKTQEHAHTRLWGGDNKRLMKASWELGVMLHWVLTSVLTFPKICFRKANFGKFLGTIRHIWRRHEALHRRASPFLFWFMATTISAQTSCDVFSVLYPGLILGDRPHILNLIFSHSVLLFWSEFWSLFFPPLYWDLFNLYASLLVHRVNKWTKQNHSEYTQSFTWLPSFCFGQVEVQPPERDSPPILHMKVRIVVTRSTSKWKKVCNILCGHEWGFPKSEKWCHWLSPLGLEILHF